jgi:hypothetical protein
MKKIFFTLFSFTVFTITGCFEVTQESTIHEDGSGVYTNSTDLGAMIGMLKSIGGAEAKEIENINKDTLVSLAYLKDSIGKLSDAENKLLENATLRILFNAADEKMLLAFSFPYNHPSDMATINEILKKTRTRAISKELESLSPGAGMGGDQGTNDKDGAPDLDTYFDYVYSAGKISKKLNKEKYAGIQSDQGMKSLQEMGQMGAPMTLKTVINLPHPAKKAEGKGLKISDDKKKITIEGTLDDLFDHPENFEYEIEY